MYHTFLVLFLINARNKLIILVVDIFGVDLGLVCMGGGRLGAGGNLGSGVEGARGNDAFWTRCEGIGCAWDLPGDHSHTRASNAPRPDLPNVFNLQFHVCTRVTISSLNPVFYRDRKGAPHVLNQEPDTWHVLVRRRPESLLNARTHLSLRQCLCRLKSTSHRHPAVARSGCATQVTESFHPRG